MNKYLIVWDGGSKHVNAIGRAKETLCQAGQSEGDLYDIHPDDEDLCKFNQHIKLF